MNKSALKKNVGHRVRLRPMAKRFLGGPTGLQLPPVDDDWLIQGIDKDGIRISNTATDHGTVLGFDHIREFTTDPARREGEGLLILKSQLHIGGCSLWVEPITPGWSPPDEFENVRGWKRENDVAHVQSLFPNQGRPPVMPRAGSGNPAWEVAFLACICIGAGLLMANA